MLVDGQYEKNVGYIMADLYDDDLGRIVREPCGTCFFIDYPLDTGFGSVRYAVTARHVIEQVREHNLLEVFLRVNTAVGKCEDVATSIHDWKCNPDTDVAVMRVDLQPKFTVWAYPLKAHRDLLALLPGHGIFFVGMFSRAPGFDSVQAIVRTGSIARPSATVPIELSGSIKRDAEVHLVESRSWGGESGSPVFVYDDPIRIPTFNTHGYPPAYELYQQSSIHKTDIRASEILPTLLGVFHGHFEIAIDVKKKKRKIGKVDANSGIGIVIPTKYLLETMRDPDLTLDRDHILTDRKQHL